MSSMKQHDQGPTEDPPLQNGFLGCILAAYTVTFCLYLCLLLAFKAEWSLILTKINCLEAGYTPVDGDAFTIKTFMDELTAAGE